MKRPTGVTVLAVLAAIGGLAGMTLGLAGLGQSGTAANLAIPGLSGLVTFLALARIAANVGELLFAYGAWQLRSWAWPLGIGLEAAVILVSVLDLRSSTAGFTFVAVAVWAGIIYYLCRPTVRRAFGQSV
jgi:hypothetical protein